MAHAWHVVTCKPRQETVAEENLRRQGFEVYLPRIRTRQRRGGRWHESAQALFPRYLFLRADACRQSLAPVRSTRGAVGLVRFGMEPAVLPDVMLDAIRARAEPETGLHDNPYLRFRPGEAVRVLAGPLAGLEGIFDCEDGARRVLVLLELLGKTHRIGMDSDAIAKLA